MKVNMFVVGFADGEDNDDCIYMEKLVNNSCFDLPRVPCIGERVGLWIEDVWIDARVTEVYTNFREHGNPHIKESAWGTDFSICLDDAEIVEQYKKRK